MRTWLATLLLHAYAELDSNKPKTAEGADGSGAPEDKVSSPEAADETKAEAEGGAPAAASKEEESAAADQTEEKEAPDGAAAE